MTHSFDRPWLLALGVLVPLACSADSGSYGFDSDGGSGGADISAGQATTGGPSPDPTTGEVEDEGDFQVPRASGKYVYSASKTTNSVAVINTATLAIDVVAVGQGPTVIQPIPGQAGDGGSVVVLDQGSDDVALLRTSEAGVTTLTIHPVTPGANNLAPAPDGKYVFVYHDVDGPEQLGPGSDQELTVLVVATGETHAMTIGAHPREVVFATDHSAAWVITAAGINVIDLDTIDKVGKPPLVPVVADAGLDPAMIEVHVAASEGVALARVDGQPWLAVTDLKFGTLEILDLPGVPTDLDVAPAGGTAVLTIPGVDGSSFIELPLPVVQGAFKAYAVEGEYVGQSALARSGDAMLLFTTVNPHGLTASSELVWRAPRFAETDASSGSDTGAESTGGADSTGGVESTTGGDAPQGDPRQRITLARRAGADWELVTLFVEVPVASVGVAPDSRSAILIHVIDKANEAAPWSYSLFDMAPAFPLIKRQTTQAAPGPVLFTPDGGRAAVLLRDDDSGIKKVDLVDLGNFIVEPLLLGSPPEGAGHVDATQKIFVSQEHPTGRITFVGAGGDVHTVTGYVLNDSVKD